MNEERNQKVLAVILSIILIGVVVYKVFFKNTKKTVLDTKTISLVKDNSEFYTVSSCINKLFIYLNSEDSESILLLLNDKYKNDNNVTTNNLYSHIKRYDGYYDFMPRKMYVQRVSQNVYKYYVYGIAQEGIYDTLGEKNDYYLIVLLDESNMTFSIEPYDGEMFNK